MRHRLERPLTGRPLGWVLVAFFAVVACAALLSLSGGCRSARGQGDKEISGPSPTGTASSIASASAEETATPTRTATETPTYTAVPSATATSSSTATPTITGTSTPSCTPTPSPSPPLVRIALPAALSGYVEQLPAFFARHPSQRFLVEVVPDDAQAAEECLAGRAELALQRGTPEIPGLYASVYRTEPIAAIVSFSKPLENLGAEELVALVSKEAATWARHGVREVLAWDSMGHRLLSADGARLPTATIADVLTRVATDEGVLGLAPYSALTPMVRALRFDGVHPSESGYRLALREAVVCRDAPEWRSLADDLADVLRSHSQANDQVTFALVGDLMLARDMGAAILEHGASYPFGAVRSLLKDADLTLGNLECVISELGEPERKAYTFRAPLLAMQSLLDAGFDLLNLANNHTLDYGPLALKDMLARLDEAGIRYVGAGMNEAEAHAPVFVESKGLRFAFLGYAYYPTETSTGFPAQAFVAGQDKPGIAWAEVERMQAEIAAAKKQADLVIVALHAGREYWEVPDDFQRVASKAAIDAGASIVWGHHAHSWQGIEFYNGGVIMYSLGDFVFDQMTTNDTAVVRLWLDRQGVKQIELVPVTIVENGRPVPAGSQKGREILDWLYGLSRALRAP